MNIFRTASVLLLALVASASVSSATAAAAAPGLANGVYGGGNTAPVYPNTIAELKAYLSDSQPRVIISNSEFDGETSFSSSCDGRHYWGFIFFGRNTRLTMYNNYIHHTSGRAPKFGGGDTDPQTDVLAHVVNNYWLDNSVHSFEVGAKSWVLMEGNYFEKTANPSLHDAHTTGALMVPTSQNAASCKAVLGRACVANTAVQSGAFTGSNDAAALQRMKGVAVVTPTAPKRLATATANFGVGSL